MKQKIFALSAVAVLVPALIASQSARAQTFTTLHSFDSTDGASPRTLVQATNGNLFGATEEGGTNGDGTVFEITTTGTLKTLHSFDGTDGVQPNRVVQDTNGDLYGTTTGGGTTNDGTVFQITTGGKLKTLQSFDSTDGSIPKGAPIQATNGKLYGITNSGGTNGDGTVFAITTNGTLATLYNFCSQTGCTDGETPLASLIQAADGNFYGTTSAGGTNGYGTVFQITANGTLTTLHSFDGTDGAYPYFAPLVQATNGYLYGTTSAGGTNGGGTVFQITTSGTLTTLHSFDGSDGSAPVSGLIQATNGKLYGTTEQNGTNGGGTVFEITTGGKLTTLYNFCSQTNCTDGSAPIAGLLQDTNGKFYGTTSAGGTNGYGTVFRLSSGLGAFVETQMTSGAVGAPVKILGTNLTGTTSVTFNGTPATFAVVSKSEISTTVPSGATTGPVEVTIPSGTLTSNVSFVVTP